jgi:hypothetical protein
MATHCNISMRDRYSSHEQLMEQLAIMKAKMERLESLLTDAESSLESIFERVKNGQDVYLDYPDGSRIHIQAKP